MEEFLLSLLREAEECGYISAIYSVERPTGSYLLSDVAEDLKRLDGVGFTNIGWPFLLLEYGKISHLVQERFDCYVCD